MGKRRDKNYEIGEVNDLSSHCVHQTTGEKDRNVFIHVWKGLSSGMVICH